MSATHTNLAKGRWQSMGIAEQMANIGSEVERTIKWRTKNPKISKNAFYRCLELVDLTLNSLTDFSKLKEVARMREVLVDYFLGDNSYMSTEENIKKYFYQFNVLARSA